MSEIESELINNPTLLGVVTEPPEMVWLKREDIIFEHYTDVPDNEKV